VTHKLEYLPQADHIIVIESGTIRHQGCFQNIKKCDPILHDYWNKIIDREEEARRKATAEECGATKERQKLVRLLSRKVSFRGNVADAIPKQRNRRISFNRFKKNLILYNVYRN
jgi:ABC-type methionine transport system ATPase subunit